jgi:hypothetical protein
MIIKKKTAVAIFCTIFVSVLFTSCLGVDNPVTTPESNSDQQTDVADVTIMYYAHGGGNLDKDIIGNLRQMYNVDSSSYKNVKVAIEYKFSAQGSIPHLDSDFEKEVFGFELDLWGDDADKELKNDDYIRWMDSKGSSTFRFALDPAKTLKEQVEESYLPDDNANFTHPDSLTNFINWAAKACPAKRYVLILNDHGGGYSPHDDIYTESAAKRATRGIVYDDANGYNHFSVGSLAHAIRQAGIRPDAIYFDACMMNNLEYLFEFKDLTDYIIASTFNVPDAGGRYETLIECLSATSGDLEYAFEKYIEYATKNWDPADETEPYYTDMTLTKTSCLDELGRAMCKFTDRLCDTYKNGSDEQRRKIDNATKNAIKVSKNYAYYDAFRYMESMKNALPDVFDATFWNELQSAFKNCEIGQYTSKFLRNNDYQVDYSVLLAVKGAYQFAWWEPKSTETWTLSNLRFFEPDGKYTTYSVSNGDFTKDSMPEFTLEYYNDGQWGGTLESTYSTLAFDKATNWTRWLLLNEQQPSLWCNNDFKTPNPSNLTKSASEIPPALGDPFWSDGTWGLYSSHSSNDKIIGVVAWLGSDSDIKCGKKHGLVMALHNAVGSCKWGGYESDEPYLDNIDWEKIKVNGNAFFVNNKNGWENTLKLTQNWPTETCHHSDHEAAMATLNYFDAPTTTANNTGWFLPSTAQWGAVIGSEGIGKYSGPLEDLNAFRMNYKFTGGGGVEESINFYINRIGGDPIRRGGYFTSNEMDSDDCLVVVFEEKSSGWYGWYNNLTYIFISRKNDNNTAINVRPFLAF